MPNDYTPRLSVEITEELYKRMTNSIPWGLKSRVMSILLEDVLDLIDTHGEIVLAAIINRSIGAKHVVRELREKEI